MMEKEMEKDMQAEIQKKMQNGTERNAAGSTTRSSAQITHGIVDCVMVILLLTLYQKNAVSLFYHEAAGLVLAAAFLVHLAVNRRWFPALFSGKVFHGGARSILAALVSVLMIFCWCGVIVTGILVSKKIFPFHVNTLIPYHFFFAAAGLILTGIHMGFHAAVFSNLVKKIPGIRSLRKPLTTILMAAIMIFGVYSFASSGMSRWISAPFVASAQHGGGAAGQTGLLLLVIEVFSMLYLVMMITAAAVKPRQKKN